MEPADRAVGDFKNASLLYNGIRSTFTTNGNRLMTRTDGPGRPDARLPGRLHLRDHAATAISRRVTRWTLPGVERGLGQRTKERAANAGSTCTPARRWITATCCTGPARRRTGISCAPTATRRTCRSGTTRRRSLRHDWSEINVSLRVVPRAGVATCGVGRRPEAARTIRRALKGLVLPMTDTGRHWMFPAGAPSPSEPRRFRPARGRDVRALPCEARACLADVRARTAAGRHAPGGAAR